jgi:D-alanyl-D-alanine carboxypeptidase/D-alanyl-D-alanine-endopeptidase (penicillin-binding protein 4)
VRRLVAGCAAVLVLLVGYATLDVFDLVPGVLTRAQPPARTPSATPAPGQSGPVVAVPQVDPQARPLQPVSINAPIPVPAKLRSAVSRLLADPALGSRPGVVVRDAFTGEHLLDVDADTPRTAASTGKLLTALAVSTTLDVHARMPTTVVQGASPSEVVLVAGGDTMLAKGRGNPAAVEGRAGIADLASQVAAALQTSGAGSVTLRLDTTYCAGARWAPGWDPADVTAGYTGGVSMLGLAGQRATPGHPAPRDPEAATAAAFAAALSKLGVTVKLASESTWGTPAPVGAQVLGKVESAPVGDVLALALDDSDNALTEGLARQAAVKAGGAATFAAAVAFVRSKVASLGVDLTGTTLKDTSGLTSGQSIPPRVLSDVLELGTDGTVPAMQDLVAELPVAGLSGTLHDRFLGSRTRAVAGLARAKTGTLTGTSAMAGTVIDTDGRVLSYVVVANHVPPGVGTLNARAALDRFVAALATCGCR